MARLIGSRTGRLRLAVVVAMMVAAVVVTATALGASRTSAASVKAAAKSCGTSVSVGPKNPHGIYKHLSPKLKRIYAAYPYLLKPGPWSKFKGVKGPWKIGFIGFPSINSYFVERLATFKKLFARAKKRGLVKGSLYTSIPASYAQFTPESQISAIQQMVREGVNLILLEPAGGTADAAAIDAAGKAGVPVVMADALMPNSKYALPIWTLNYPTAEAKTLGRIKSGDILVVRGAQGNTLDNAVYNQLVADLKVCPNIHIAGTVYGEYATSTTKTVVQQFLASHPGKIAGVVEQGGMYAGVVQAFQAVGRSVPPVALIEPSGGELSYWYANKSTVNQVGQGINGRTGAYTFFNASLRILAGREPKLNVLGIPAPVMTNRNLGRYAPKGKDISADVEPLGKPASWCSKYCLAKFFKHKGGPTVKP